MTVSIPLVQAKALLDVVSAHWNPVDDRLKAMDALETNLAAARDELREEKARDVAKASAAEAAKATPAF